MSYLAQTDDVIGLDDKSNLYKVAGVSLVADHDWAMIIQIEPQLINGRLYYSLVGRPQDVRRSYLERNALQLDRFQPVPQVA